MNYIKSTLAIATIALFTNCAGITEANFDDAPTVNAADSDRVINQELPDFFNGGDQEDIIEVKPKSKYDERD